jgi:hypothetical protein
MSCDMYTCQKRPLGINWLDYCGIPLTKGEQRKFYRLNYQNSKFKK